MHLVFTHNVQDETKSSVLGCLGESGNVALSTSVLHKIEVREKCLGTTLLCTSTLTCRLWT